MGKSIRIGWLVLLLLLAPAGSRAQVVTGRLLDGGTREPILLGTVALLDTTMAVVDQVFTNEKGEFRLVAKQPGSYYVIADRIGYTGAVDGILEMGEGGSATIEFYLAPRPVELAAINVSAARQHERLLNDAGFFDRQRMGFGHFITPEDIQKRPPFDEAELLRRAPFVGVEYGFGGTAVNVLSRGTRCVPDFYVDGMPITFAPGMEGVISSAVNVDEIIAAEVYRGVSEIPTQWGAFNTCGVILIWTRRGG